MKLSTGFKGKADDIGMSIPIACPACGENTPMHITKCSNKVQVLAVPVATWNSEYLVTCPKCASVFSLDTACGDAYRNGNTAFFTSDRLTPLHTEKK